MHRFGGDVIDRLSGCTKDTTIVETVLSDLKAVVHQSMQSEHVTDVDGLNVF